MINFYSISSFRENIDKYLKKDTYTNCKSDLCIFFEGKSIEDIFNSPILLAPNDQFRYIKSRLNNSNLNKGKRGCYRLYYYVDSINQNVFLLGFYPKNGKYGRGDLTDTEEKIMINEYKSEHRLGVLVEHNINKNFEELPAKKPSDATKRTK